MLRLKMEEGERENVELAFYTYVNGTIDEQNDAKEKERGRGRETMNRERKREKNQWTALLFLSFLSERLKNELLMMMMLIHIRDERELLLILSDMFNNELFRHEKHTDLSFRSLSN